MFPHEFFVLFHGAAILTGLWAIAYHIIYVVKKHSLTTVNNDKSDDDGSQENDVHFAWSRERKNVWVTQQHKLLFKNNINEPSGNLANALHAMNIEF